MNLNCIIIDDEPNAVNLLEILIGQNTKWQLLAKCYDALEAIAFLKENKPDFIFLDINMPNLSGISMVKVLNTPPRIIFTTAYSEFAVESYEINAVDYLLKPFSFESFTRAVYKAIDMIEKGKTVPPS